MVSESSNRLAFGEGLVSTLGKVFHLALEINIA